MTKKLGTTLMILGTLASVGSAVFGILNTTSSSNWYENAAIALIFAAIFTFLPGLMIRDAGRAEPRRK